MIPGVDTQKVKELLMEISNSTHGVYRKFLGRDEVKICNHLTKEGFLYKSKPDEKNATVAFFISPKGSEYLENN